MQTTSYQAPGYQELLNNLGATLYGIRKRRNMSQEIAANMVGMDRVSLGYIEQGRRAPSLSVLHNLSELYRVPVSDFFANAGKNIFIKDPDRDIAMELTYTQVDNMAEQVDDLSKQLSTISSQVKDVSAKLKELRSELNPPA